MVSEAEIKQFELHEGDILIERFDAVQKRFDAIRESLAGLISGVVEVSQLEKFIDDLDHLKGDLDAVIEEGSPTDDAWVLEGNINNLLDEIYARMNALKK